MIGNYKTIITIPLRVNMPLTLAQVRCTQVYAAYCIKQEYYI